MIQNTAMKCVIFFLLLSFTLLNCKKDNPAFSLKQEMEGKWELKTRYGGWIGTQNFTEGNGNTITFSGDNYSRVNIADGISYENSGTFTVFTDSACNGVGETVYISFLSLPPQADVEDINITSGELVIGQNSCIADGTTSIYRKIK